MFILKKGHQPGVYVPLRALFLVNCIIKLCLNCFGNPDGRFLAHLSRRLIGELIVYPWSGVRCRTSSVHNAQTSSSQKPLGRLKPNFMWSLLG